MRNKIPEDIRMRKGKLAFSVPQKKWLESIKGEIVKTFEDDFRSVNFIDREKVLQLVKSSNYNDKLIFRAFNLERWMKVFNLQ